MKNFPHQYSDFGKLRSTLAAIRDLNADGADVADDAVLGYELARRGIYTFTGTAMPLEQRIALEQRKPPGSQGPRTAAREMRRTLRHLGWLDVGAELTPAGTRYLSTAAAGEDERAEWQRALLDLTLEDAEGNVSHPVRILLRLVSEFELVERRGSELALEARDDSEQEYRRIASLMQLGDAERERRVPATGYQIANARKILPRFAEQAGLIHRRSATALYTLTEAGRAALGEGFDGRPIDLPPRPFRGRPSRGSRRVRAGTVARPVEGDPERWAALSREEQIAATRLRFERTARHQDLLAALVGLVDGEGIELYEDASSFDLLRVSAPPAPLTIYEVKTLEVDDLTQTRLAVGQLLSYEHLNVRPRWPGREVERAVVYERPVGGELTAFLGEIGIAAFALVDGELVRLS